MAMFYTGTVMRGIIMKSPMEVMKEHLMSSPDLLPRLSQKYTLCPSLP